MLSKNKIKYIQSFDQKKHRSQSGCFLAEGNKLVTDTIDHFECELLVATPEWLLQHAHMTALEIIEATSDEIKKASLLKSPQDVIAIYRQPDCEFNPEALSGSLSLMLDTVQDPGNLGTIVRLADWFGIKHIICSPDCADIYNPKTVQATMGAIARVKVHYRQLTDLLNQLSATLPVYGTFLDGKNMYTKNLTPHGIIVMGNEGKGVSDAVASFITERIYIPPYPADAITSESLNVAIATAIVCAEFRRPR